MMVDNLFFNSIEIQNYKCFQSVSLNFNEPDGENAGSGLNILIGENGTGKTSILEAIAFLTQSKYSSENKLSIADFNDYTKDLKINGKIKAFDCKSSIDFYKDFHFKCNGILFEAKSRDRKEANKILSSPFSIKNQFLLEGTNYYKGSEEKGAIDSRDTSFSDSRIKNGNIDVFYFDKNRSRHLVSGTYKTTFDKICDDLNWKFIKNLPGNVDKIKKNITGEYFSNTLDISQKDVGKKLAEEMSKFFDNEIFKGLKIDLLDILQPFSNASLVIRNDEDLKQINTKSLGSGVEIIMTLLLLKALSIGAKNSSVIYLIDEPELHLHPKAQEALARILLEESKDKQIIISTHSPYMFKELIPYSGLITLRKGQDGCVEINKEDGEQKDSLLPWSPSWGEINFKAYDMATTDFHNELYGYLVELSEKYKTCEFEAFLKEKDVNTEAKKWKRIKLDGNELEENVSLHTFIRHSIHHPENNLNSTYSREELKQSTNEMIKIIKDLKAKNDADTK